jgi:DNA-binding NarL/FixJ family response regulator
MSLSVIILENSEKLQEIIKNFLERNRITVLGTYTHNAFIGEKPLLKFDVAIISFRANMTFTRYTIEFLRNYYKSSKVALLVSKYDSVSLQELATLQIDGGIRKATDDPNELLVMLDAIMAGQRYVNLTTNPK